MAAQQPVNAKAVVQTEAPKWSVQTIPDASCPVRTSLDVRQSVAAPVVPPDTSAIRASLEWLLAAAEQMEPQPRFKLGAVVPTVQGDLLTVAGSIAVSDDNTPVPESLRNGFLQAVEALSRTNTPSDGQVLCLDIKALSGRLGATGLTREPFKLRVPRAALESIAQSQMALQRTGIVALEGADGFTLAETQVPWPALLRTRPAAECGCDLLLEADKPRTEPVKFEFAFAPVAMTSLLPRAFVSLRFTAAGEPARRLAVVEPNTTKLDTGNKLTDLLMQVYAPARLGADLSGPGAAKVTAGGWTLDINALAQQVAAMPKVAAEDVVERVCFRGSDPASLVAVPVDAKQWQQWSGALGGIEHVQRTVVLDLKRAGLADDGAVAVDLDAAGRKVLQRMLAQGKSGSWTVRLNKLIKRESSAYLKLPAQRIDGKQDVLKVRIELSTDVVLAESDVAVLFEATAGVLAFPIKQFPSPGATYASLTNVWGGAKKIAAPGQSFSLEGEPGELELRVAGKALERKVMVLATDGKGSVLDAAEGALSYPIAADRVVTPQCSIILSAAETARSIAVTLPSGAGASSIKALEVHHLDRARVRFRQGLLMRCDATHTSNCIASAELVAH
ncbi:MAG: hypothetical protein FJ100_18965 [Deltaproteobacteria bacterium]|nr:hypothetical protein [Deltaproteobacteria bacterium]